MYARVSRYQASPQQVDQGIQVFQQTSPQIRQMQGFKKAYLLVDRQSGKAITVSLWESEEAMRQSEAATHQLRTQGAQAMGGSVSEVEFYELAEEV